MKRWFMKCLNVLLVYEVLGLAAYVSMFRHCKNKILDNNKRIIT